MVANQQMNEQINELSFEFVKMISSKGYILLCIPDHPDANKFGYIYEHRYLVEKKIGRLLRKEETVHHLNFDKQDNRIENLMLFKNQKEHMSFHLKLSKYGITNSIARQIENRWINI